ADYSSSGYPSRTSAARSATLSSAASKRRVPSAPARGAALGTAVSAAHRPPPVQSSRAALDVNGTIELFPVPLIGYRADEPGRRTSATPLSPGSRVQGVTGARVERSRARRGGRVRHGRLHARREILDVSVLQGSALRLPPGRGDGPRSQSIPVTAGARQG